MREQRRDSTARMTLLVAALALVLGTGARCTDVRDVTNVSDGADGASLLPVNEIMIDLGLVPVGKTVTIVFEATIDSPLLPPGTVSQVSTQGLVSGSNFADALTDDPDTPATDDPTTTQIVYVEGDLNMDGLLDFPTDSAVFFAQFGDSVPPFSEPDYDGDGVVGIADYSVFLSFF